MDVLNRARQFFSTHGRDIDRARFNYHFGNLPQEALLEELGRYQNPDGGFWGLEIDIKAPVSNPFATEIALDICAQAGVPASHPLLQRTVKYLENTQEEDGGWRFSDDIYKHELAPWFQGWWFPAINPSCTLAGFLKTLGLGSIDMHGRVEALFQSQAKVDDLLGDQYYNVRPYAYYFMPEWNHPERETYLAGVLWWLIRQHIEGKIEDSHHFLDYVRSPQTYTGRLLPGKILEERLDSLIEEQAEDGGWPSPYDPDWRGPVTVQNLLILRAFGRV